MASAGARSDASAVKGCLHASAVSAGSCPAMSAAYRAGVSVDELTALD
jgi:hypothetical protein